MQIQTINVIFMNGPDKTSVQRLVSFPNDNKGVSDAEDLFKKIILDEFPGVHVEDVLEDALENGYFEQYNSDNCVMIVHSTG